MTRLNRFQTTLKVLSFFSFFLSSIAYSDPKVIGITQIVDHPSLNAIREGVLESLAQQGFKEGSEFTVIFENAQGNPTTAAQIAKKFASLPLDVIIPITTPSAQAIAQQVKTTPIVFAAITDPLAAKIVMSFDRPGGNVTGVADIPPLKQQLAFIKKAVPSLKTLGIIYNPGEVNMVSFVEQMKILAKQEHITLLTAAAPKSVDVQAAAQSLIERVDAIFIGNDNTIVSGLEPLVKICLNFKKPLFMSDPDSVERGAFAAHAYDQRKIGQQVGVMVAKILKGKSPGNLPVETPQNLEVFTNHTTAQAINLPPPTAHSSSEK